MIFGEWLKECRLKANISQTYIAKCLGYKSSQFISNWERGVSEIPAEALPILAKTLNVDFEKLSEIYIEVRLGCLEREIRGKFFKNKKNQ